MDELIKKFVELVDESCACDNCKMRIIKLVAESLLKIKLEIDDSGLYLKIKSIGQMEQ